MALLAEIVSIELRGNPKQNALTSRNTLPVIECHSHRRSPLAARVNLCVEAEGLYDGEGSPDTVHSPFVLNLVLFLYKNPCTTTLKTGSDNGEVGFRALYFD
jgi:hypothetical protein